MPSSALLLILVSAVAHASWNLLVKSRVHTKHLILFASAGEASLFLPAAAWAITESHARLGFSACLCLLATGVLHVLYTEALLRGYRAADLSVVYPIARGTAPLVASLGAMALLGEHPSLQAGGGLLSVCAGVLCISGGTFEMRAGLGVAWGVVTGLIVASTALVDAYSVRVLELSPLVVEYAGNLFRVIVLTAVARRQHDTLAADYRAEWKAATAIGVLTMASYTLALFAIRLAPLSMVMPLRETSMLIGTIVSARLFNEAYGRRRTIGAALIALGAFTLVRG